MNCLFDSTFNLRIKVARAMSFIRNDDNGNMGRVAVMRTTETKYLSEKKGVEIVARQERLRVCSRGVGKAKIARVVP